ncbi:MAG: hypothetical protein ACKVX7_17790 [Planctomycetota bacterium]
MSLVEMRTLSRQYELFHLPAQYTPEQLREIYFQVSRSCEYDNFLRLPGGARLEVAAGEGVSNESSVTFTKDRIFFREESVGGSREHLLKRVTEVLTVAVEKVGLPFYIARNITLRAVCQTPRGMSSTAFMAEHLFKINAQHNTVFDRPAQLVGFRMQFPCRDPLREATHQLRIETYMRDARSLYVEDIASYKVPVPARDLARVETEFRDAEVFLHDQVGKFLGQFGE